MGLTLGLVGERAFTRQVSRNEFWNHAGNVASLAGIYMLTVAFGMNGIVGLMIATAIGAVIAALLAPTAGALVVALTAGGTAVAPRSDTAEAGATEAGLPHTPQLAAPAPGTAEFDAMRREIESLRAQLAIARAEAVIVHHVPAEAPPNVLPDPDPNLNAVPAPVGPSLAAAMQATSSRKPRNGRKPG